MKTIVKRTIGIIFGLAFVFATMIILVKAQGGELGFKSKTVYLMDGKVDDSIPVAAKRTREIDQPQIYLIRLQEPPLASYRGEIPGLEATNPGARGERKLNPNSPASIAYKDYLLSKQDEFIKRAEEMLDRSLDVKYHYYAANNGLAIYLTPSEAAKVKTLPEVKFMQPNFERKLMTDVSPQWIGATTIWDGTNTGGLAGTQGEGVIIGVIDTGINPSNPSFADVGGDGYDHTNPWGSGNYVGVCDPGNSSYDATFPCNDKLIGAWGYSQVNDGDPRDYHSHGSHTSSTAGGNHVTAHLIGNTITADRDISGIAPHANIVMYAACCDGDALSAAIDQIVLDGVDVVNYSIGSTAPSDPWNDFDTVGFLEARDAGIFVATSAGNAGPNPDTIGSPGDAPWLLTVAASSHNRKTTNALIDMSGGNTTPPADIYGVSFTSGYGPAEIVYAGDYGDALCLNSFPAGTFDGEIVICDRGEIARVDKGQHVLDGGAGGYILANAAANGDSLVSDDHYLPAVHITYDDGVILKAWVTDGGSSHVGTIRGTLFEINDEWGDIMTDFSSRGADRALPGILKPDITAPGEDILAAGGQNDPDPPVWEFMGGTSMASPHMAGAGALLTALHPDWTPAEMQSALMTTAWQDVLDYDAETPADPFDDGSGRVDLTVAAKAGLVLNETKANYDAANPDTGGDPKTLNLASMADGACWHNCSWTRTVRSTLDVSMDWTVTASASSGMDLTVTPSSFTIPAGGTQTITIEANVDMADPDTWVFGEVQLTPADANVPPAHLPVAAYANSTTDPQHLEKTADIKMVQLGNTIQYTITLTHKSLSAKTYDLTDPIPDNASYVDGSATGGLTYNSGTNSLTWSDTLPAGTFVISEENKSGYVSMGELGASPADLPSGGGDDSCWLVDLDIYYFDKHYTDGVWSTNGVLQVGKGELPFPTCAGSGNTALPTADLLDNILAPWWADLNLDDGGKWYYVGVSYDGKQHTVFEWENVPIKGTSDTATFQIWIEDGTDNIWFSYPEGGLPSGSPTATVGAENEDGSIGAQYYYNGSGKIPDGTVDLVVGPEPIIKEFGFQLQADGVPGITNDVKVEEGGNTNHSYAYTDVYNTNSWLGYTTDWHTASNWSRSSVPVDTDWVTIPTSPSGGNMPVLTADAAVRNLEIESGASLDLATYQLTVEDTLVNNGTLKQTQSSVPAGSTTKFLSITNASGAQMKYLGLEITPDSSSMGNTSVAISGNSECTVTDPTDTVNRCFEITPTNQETATVRFYYLVDELDGQDPTAMKAWHWGGSGWSEAGSVEKRDDVYPDYNWVEVSGVSAYSPFTLSDKVGGPTVVALREFTSRVSFGGYAVAIGLIVLLLGGWVWVLAKRKRV